MLHEIHPSLTTTAVKNNKNEEIQNEERKKSP